MSSLKKNTASQTVTFCLVVASTGAALTGASPTVYVTKDGTQSTAAGTVTETAHGGYSFAPTQADTNGTNIGYLITASTAVPVNLDFHTDIVDANGFVGVNLVDIAGSAVSTTTAQLGVNAVQVNGQTTSAAGTVTFPGSIASPTNITAGTITTVTNLTNAPTAGDLTATMKASVTTAATAATPTALLTSGTGTGQVTLSSGILAANVNGDLTSTMKTSVTTAATAATPTVLLTPGTSTGQVTLAAGVLTANANGDLTATMKTSVTTAATAATPTVLLTPGTSTGQVSLTSGVLVSSLSGDLTSTMKTSVTTAVPTAAVNAAALLKYDVSTITGEADRSLLNAIRFIRNKWTSTIGTLTVYKEDDSTTAWTATVSTDGTALPVVGISGSS